MKRREHNYYVYILASQKNGTLYIGVSNSLSRRITEHKKTKDKNSFVSKYKVDKLVYFERFKYIYDALAREKKLKRYRRAWKIGLIEEMNPGWIDLFEKYW